MTNRLTNYLRNLEIENQEFVIVAPDCGLRPWRRIKGQADYRADAEERENALFSDAESTTRYMAAVGRTGAVLLCIPIQTESGTYMAQAIRNHWPRACRDQVRYAAVDNATEEVEECLRLVCEHLEALIQDNLHPCFNMEHGQARKGDKPFRVFRQCMAK